MRRLLVTVILFGLVLVGCGPAEPEVREVEVPITVREEVPATVQVPVTVEVEVEVPVTVLKMVTPTPKPTPKPTATPEVKLGSMKMPVPMGESFGLVMGKTKKFNMAIIEVLRGDEAWQVIYARNQFNDPPTEGQEYVLLRIEIDYYEGPSGEVLELDKFDLEIVSNGQVMESPSVVEPDPEFDLALFPGAKADGWVSKLVHIDDPAPLLAIGMDSHGQGGFFFAIQ